MYLARWLMGEPKRITSMFNHYTDHEVEDNAVALIEFANKGIAVVETGFVSPAALTLELHGTEGTFWQVDRAGRTLEFDQIEQGRSRWLDYPYSATSGTTYADGSVNSGHFRRCTNSFWPRGRYPIDGVDGGAMLISSGQTNRIPWIKATNLKQLTR